MEFGDQIYRRHNDKTNLNRDGVSVSIEWLSGQKIEDTHLPLSSMGTYAVARDSQGKAIAAIRLHLNSEDVVSRSTQIDKIWSIDAMDLLGIDH